MKQQLALDGRFGQTQREQWRERARGACLDLDERGCGLFFLVAPERAEGLFRQAQVVRGAEFSEGPRRLQERLCRATGLKRGVGHTEFVFREGAAVAITEHLED